MNSAVTSDNSTVKLHYMNKKKIFSLLPMWRPTDFKWFQASSYGVLRKTFIVFLNVNKCQCNLQNSFLIWADITITVTLYHGEFTLKFWHPYCLEFLYTFSINNSFCLFTLFYYVEKATEARIYGSRSYHFTDNWPFPGFLKDNCTLQPLRVNVVS